MKLLLPAAALEVFLLSLSALAGTMYTVNSTVTLNPAFITSISGIEEYNQDFVLPTPFAVQSGDEITGTISFTNGPLQIAAPDDGHIDDSVAFDLLSAINPTTTTTANFDFLGLAGTLGTSNPTPVLSFSGGPPLAAKLSYGNPVDYSFTGFIYTIDIISVAPEPLAITYAQISANGESITIGAAATPEPSTFIVCAAGFALLASMRRRLQNV